ncbi:glycosyltransferase [Soonwooa purpurea]
MTGSIVLFNTDVDIIKKAINSFLYNYVVEKLYLIDNSLEDTLRNIVGDSRIEYIHNPSNPGFGAAHNIAIKKALELGSKYHFIVNPDIYFSEDVIGPMLDHMGKNPNVGMMMPQILNEDGSIQNLPKLLPSPFSILLRKIKKPNFLYSSFINKYELRNVPNDQVYEAPILSGCFTLLNLDAIKDVGLYDDRFFMYFEDWDLSRRINQKYKTIYFPKVSVYHGYESGANKSKKLFKIFLNSAVHYFNKWGWFFDKKRNEVNERTLSQFK